MNSKSRSVTGGSRFCEVPGCKQTTREGKPYCPDHVENNSYVQGILAHLAEQEEEEVLARDYQRGFRKVRHKVNLNGPVASAILLHLDQCGSRTVERLARETLLDSVVLDHYIEALVKADLVCLGQTQRGSTTVKRTATPVPTAQPKAKPKRKSKPKRPT